MNPIINFGSSENQKLFVCPICNRVTQITKQQLLEFQKSFNFSLLNIENYCFEIDNDIVIELSSKDVHIGSPICCQEMSICDPDTIELAKILAALGASYIEINAGDDMYMSRFYTNEYTSLYSIIFALPRNRDNGMIHNAIIESTLSYYGIPDMVWFEVFETMYTEGLSYFVNIRPNDSKFANRENFINFCNVLKSNLFKCLI